MYDSAPGTLPVSPLQSVTRVRELLHALGDALVSWRLNRVEALQEELADAVTGLPSDSLPELDPPTRKRLATELSLVAGALARCHRLGQSISELARLHAHALGETEGYNAAGAKTASGALPLLRTRA